MLFCEKGVSPELLLDQFRIKSYRYQMISSKMVLVRPEFIIKPNALFEFIVQLI